MNRNLYKILTDELMENIKYKLFSIVRNNIVYRESSGLRFNIIDKLFDMGGS